MVNNKGKSNHRSPVPRRHAYHKMGHPRSKALFVSVPKITIDAVGVDPTQCGPLIPDIRCAIAGESGLLILDTRHGLGSRWHLTAERPQRRQLWPLGVFLSK